MIVKVFDGYHHRLVMVKRLPMKNATLRQLKVFESVARNLSFSRAAEELHLTQPAVSTQVGKLEEHAGLPLFEQLGKKIHLTPAGAEMLRASRAIIQQFKEVEDAMTQFKGVSGGKLNVTVISAGDYFFPQAAGGVRAAALGSHAELRRVQPRGTAGPARRQPHRPGHHGAAAGGNGHGGEPFAPHPYVVVAAARPSAGREAGAFPCRAWRASRSSCARRARTPGTPWKRGSANTWRNSTSPWKSGAPRRSSRP